MKKAIFGIMILALIFASSCKKNTSNGPVTSGNSWTFEGTTYKTTHCSVTTYLEAYSDTPVYYGTIQVNFPHNVIPTINGTYTVVNDQIYTLAPNQVNIGMTIGGLSGINYY